MAPGKKTHSKLLRDAKDRLELMRAPDSYRTAFAKTDHADTLPRSLCQNPTE